VGVRLLWLALLCPALALAADASGTARLQASFGVDTNPGRDFGDLATPDAAASLTGEGQGALREGALRLEGSYALGGRLFASQHDANVLVQAARASAATAVGPLFTLGLEGRAKDRRAGSRGRAYTDLTGGPFLAFSPSRALSFELHAALRRFLYRDAFAFSFGAGELTLLGHTRLSRRHGLTLSLFAARQRYGVEAVDASGLDLGTRRVDGRLGAEAGYRYRGPFALSLGYRLERVDSNSFGEAQLRHRLSASVGVRLPFQALLLVEGALELTHYPDGVFLSPQLLLLEDDEGLTSAAARLVRPLNAHVDLELRYGLYQTRLSQNGLSYLRQLATAGATVRF
jgi:hypothetical protein